MVPDRNDVFLNDRRNHPLRSVNRQRDERVEAAPGLAQFTISREKKNDLVSELREFLRQGPGHICKAARLRVRDRFRSRDQELEWTGLPHHRFKRRVKDVVRVRFSYETYLHAPTSGLFRATCRLKVLPDKRRPRPKIPRASHDRDTRGTRPLPHQRSLPTPEAKCRRQFANGAPSTHPSSQKTA